MEKRKALGLVSAGIEKYRRYLLEQLAGRYDVWLISDEALTWQHPFIKGHAKIADYEPGSIDSAINEIQTRQPLSGLVCWDERHVIATADAAVRFNWPSAGMEGIRGCRDKSLSRQKLSAAKLWQPQSRLCLNVEDAVTFARTVAYPLVVKPRGMGASIGVALVSNEAELHLRYREACEAGMQGSREFQTGALVEEYIEGPEISVDGRVVNGAYEAMFVARKSVGLPPHFEELGHVVDAADVVLQDTVVMANLREAHRAIGFENGITHTELKLTPRGPVIIEINGRLGGDLIPYLASLATGLKPGEIAGDIACGEPVPLGQTASKGAAAIRFCYPECDLQISALWLPAPTVEEGVGATCVALAEVGTHLALPPSAYAARAAYAIAVGDDAKTCQRVSQRLVEAVQINQRTQPPTPKRELQPT